MALVMLPCDLPWWSVVQKKLKAIQESDDLNNILEIMQRIHDLCNVSLDPDEDKRDSTILNGLKDYVENDMEINERQHFLTHTLNIIAKRASALKILRPPRGLEFSLQQQVDSVELDYRLVASLLANAFFSTFPKRTAKTHPTLQDFNFTYFFSGLETNSQKAKFKSFLYYYDWLEEEVSNDEGSIKVSRKVMHGKNWLTIEDWLECGLLLCPLEIKHQNSLERTSHDALQTIFVNSKIGGNVLFNGNSQECIQFSTFPELLVLLLYMEALEDNEAITIDCVRQITRIIDPKRKAIIEKLDKPRKMSVCCMDAENYSDFPIHQFEEDNVLRELNKCLLAYRQNSTTLISEHFDKRGKEFKDEQQQQRRLSPIGESGTNSPDDVSLKIFIKQASTSTKRSSTNSSNSRIEEDINKRRSWLQPDQPTNGSSNNNNINNNNNNNNSNSNCGALVVGPTASGRRGRFIILGSSGECLPVNRKITSRGTNSSLYSSCDSSFDEFLSAKGSVDEESEDENEEYANKYSKELDTPERRFTFAQKLRDALRSESLSTSSTADSYAVDISVNAHDENEIRLRRGGSRGFMLTEDSLDEDFYKDSLLLEREWLNKFKNKQNGQLQRKDTNESSKYSFSSEYSSELEEVYDQFSKWLEDPILEKNNVRELEPRDEAVLKFASSLLKRTLSESFVGVPLTEGCVSSASAEDTSINSYQQKRNRLILNPRSLSLELAKHKHRLASQLKNENDYENQTTPTPSSSSLDNDNDLSRQSTISTQTTISSPSSSLRRVKRNYHIRTNSNTTMATNNKQIQNVTIKFHNNKNKIKWSISNVQSEQNINCDDVTFKLVTNEEKISEITQRRGNGNNSGLRPIATGNWGCGNTKRGDVQLKLVIQWMAASVTGLPVLIYYTSGHERLSKLDTVCRVLLDRKWNVGELASATLLHARDVLTDPFESSCDCFFEKLIGLER